MPFDLQPTPPTAWGVATYPPGATFGPRRTRDWEFVWIIEGTATYRWDDEAADAPPGAVVLCRPGGTDAFRWDPHRRTRHAYFHFSVAPSPEAPGDAGWPLVRGTGNGTGDDDILLPLFRYILTWAGRGDGETVRAAVAALLAAFRSGETRTRDVPRDALPDPVERALSFLHGRLEDTPADAVPLAELARAACVTPEHLCRLFRAATGRTPGETVRLARLDRAAALLVRSNYSVGEVAVLCGFPSPFHFSRRFKEAFGRSPSDVRRDVRTGGMPPMPRLLRRGVPSIPGKD
jgi:AraC-like DNA-binding protein